MRPARPFRQRPSIPFLARLKAIVPACGCCQSEKPMASRLSTPRLRKSSCRPSRSRQTRPVRLSRPHRRGLIRKAFVLKLRRGKAAEYLKRHNRIWPALLWVLKSQGVHNYSIYYQSSRRCLFAYVELEDESRWREIARTKIGQRWRKYMSDILQTDADFSPIVEPLVEMFHLP